VSILKVGPAHFIPALVIFDKDGTLIDFDSMWGPWMIQLADRVEALTKTPLRHALYTAFGFDAAHNHVVADGKLAITPMADLYDLTIAVLQEQGLTADAASAAVAQAWFVPHPLALARPVTPLPALFAALRAGGLKVAVATTDDREPTLATMRGLGADHLIDTLICADDGIKVKPAPDMVTIICERLGVRPGQAVMVGDSVADLQMGKAAGAGLVVGVLTGVSSASKLAPLADVVLDSIAGLI